jgi:hypothetical protein
MPKSLLRAFFPDSLFPLSRGQSAPEKPPVFDREGMSEDIPKPPPLGTLKKPKPDKNEEKKP